MAPVHVFYYGLVFAGDRAAPCTAGGGEDTELFGPEERPRAAASAILPALGGDSAPLFGPSPGGLAMRLAGAGVGWPGA